MSEDKDVINRHIIDAEKVLKSLDNAKNNTNLSETKWKETIAYKRERLIAFIKDLKREDIPIEHFK